MQMVKEEYKKSFCFIREIKWIFLGVVIAFIVLSFIVYALLLKYPQFTESFYQSVYAMMSQKGIPEQAGIGMALSLFANNFVATGMMILLGFIPFVFLPVYGLISNSAVVAVVFAMVKLYSDLSVFQLFVIGILPHGIFEFPALFLAMSMGIYLCWSLCLLIVSSKKARPFKETVLNILRTMVLIIVPLLILAAAVEGFVTPMLMQAFI